MKLEHGGNAPYTSGTALIAVLDWFRERAGEGARIDQSTLGRIGVPDSIGSRTLSSLALLGLIDENSMPTSEWVKMSKVRGDDEYRDTFQQWLREAYSDVLSFCDPTSDDYAKIVQGFLGYKPVGQRKAMASLLVSLWKHAGLPLAESTTHQRPASQKSVRPQQRVSDSRRKRVSTQDRKERSVAVSPGFSTLPPALVGLLRQIPLEQGWTETERDNFLHAFAAVVDFTVPVVPNTSIGTSFEEEA